MKEGYGYILELGQSAAPERVLRADSPLMYSQGYRDPLRHVRTTRKIRELYAMFQFRYGSSEERIRAFRDQAVFMKDYADEAPCRMDFKLPLPCYEMMSVEQLRGYFTWRANVRQGIYDKASRSVALVYINELLNGIGVGSARDLLDKLRRFESGFVDMMGWRKTLGRDIGRWMFDVAVIFDLPVDTAKEIAKEFDLYPFELSEKICVLKNAGNYTDGEVFEALSYFLGESIDGIPLVKENERGKELFAKVWKRGVAGPQAKKDSFFPKCFGRMRRFAWKPLEKALCVPRGNLKDRDIVINDAFHFRCKDGKWTEMYYDGDPFFVRDGFDRFLHGTELVLRKYLAAGAPLRRRPDEDWVVSCAEAVVEEDKKAAKIAEIEAARRNLRIDVGDLDRIRVEAVATRDSLLTEEERFFDVEQSEEQTVSQGPSGIELGEDEEAILRMLLKGDDVKGFIRERRILASVAADSVNEALFDEIGDSVLECDGEELAIVEDYREDLKRLLGGI